MEKERVLVRKSVLKDKSEQAKKEESRLHTETQDAGRKDYFAFSICFCFILCLMFTFFPHVLKLFNIIILRRSSKCPSHK